MDPATAALLTKIATSVATDNRTWQIIGAVVAGILFIMLLPIIILMSVGSGGADMNRQIADIVFNDLPIPAETSAENIGYIEDMKEAFAKLDIEIGSINLLIEKEVNADGNEIVLDDIRIKSTFFVLCFGESMSLLDADFYKDFVMCFVVPVNGDNSEGDPDTNRYAVIKDLDELHESLGVLITISEANKQNIANLYSYIKYGFVPNSNGFVGGIPSEAMKDDVFAKLANEATKYIGMPYVWGGSSPRTSFDCSGFVCYAYTNSGVYNLPRTTAQGIYNQCTPVPAKDIKPGDLVFFTKTYKTSDPVTHIGIYVGNETMLHCGDPIGYANFNSAYWSKFFYGFGRLGS